MGTNNDANQNDIVYDGVTGSRAYIRANSADMVAPFNLPHGAKITRVTYYFYDDTGSNMDFYLYKKAFATNTDALVGSTTTSAGVTGWGSKSMTVASESVDNSLYTYRIRVHVGATDIEQAIAGVLIEYTQ